MSRHIPSICESLESRRLLTFELTATAGDDLIQVSYDLSDDEYQFTLNGQPAGVTQDVNVEIEGLSGHDTIMLYHVADGTSILLLPGIGNDRVEVGNGSLAGNLHGDVTISDAGGLDELIANDSLDSFTPDSPVTVGTWGVHFAIFSSPSAGDAGSVRFLPAVENVHLLCSDGPDTVYVDAVRAGTLISLSGGNDKVMYGGDEHVVPDLDVAVINGGSGIDQAIFDDGDRPDSAGNPSYQITTSAFLDQQFISMENAQLFGPTDEFFNTTTLTMTGDGTVSDSITVRGESMIFLLGTESSPIDVDNATLRLDVQFTGSSRYEIHDQDFDNSGSAFIMYTDIGGPATRQHIDKGLFQGTFKGFTQRPFIYAGSTDDTFAIGGIFPDHSPYIYGGGGDDAVHTVGINNHDNDLDAIGHFFYYGGSGDDFIDLDDSGDQTNDGDEIYQFTGDFDGQNMFVKGFSYNHEVEHINFVADADSNTIFFRGANHQNLRIAIDGGAGDDTIVNDDPWDTGLFFDVSATITGNAGYDTLVVNDRATFFAPTYSTDEYNLTSTAFSYHNALFNRTFTWNYSAIENMAIDQNDRATSTTRIMNKPAGMSLYVSGYGGSDSIMVGGGDIDGSGISATTTTLLGGNGDDRIEFDDRLDDHSFSDADAFTFEFQRVTKDGVAILYGGFESQKLYTSGVNSSQFYFPNTVRLHGIDMPTEIVGSPGNRDNFVDLGHPTWGVSQVTFGAITLDFDDAPAVVSVYDEVASAARGYRLTATQLFLPSVVNYSGVAGINIYAGSGNDTFNVDATAAGTSAFFAGNNGDDLMSLGSGGPFSALAGPVYVRGNNGNDELFMTNGLGGGFTDATFTSGSFTANGGPVHSYDTAERIHVIVNDAGSDIDVMSSDTLTTIHGAAGADRVSVGAGDLATNPIYSLQVEGGAGQDAMEFNDIASADPFGNYIFDLDGSFERFIRFSNAPASVVFSTGVEHRTLHANDTATVIRVYDTYVPLRINANGGHDGIYVDDSAVPVTISSGAGMDYLRVGDHFGNTSPVVVFEQDDELAGMSLRATGTVRLQAGAVLCNLGTARDVIGEPVIGGTLDVGEGAYLGKPGQYALTTDAIRALIARGYNNGAWNGTHPQGAINSSLAAGSSPADAIGYGLGSDIAISSIGAFTINASDTLVRYTFYGDTDLNRQVDFDDYIRTDGGFNTASAAWSNGDFDFNNAIDFDDYILIDLGFNGQ